MDSGWAQFRVLYNFEPRDRRDIAIQEGDIMIVAKPVLDYSDWLTGENRRTGEVGEFPGTYVEYIGDIEVLPKEENNDKPPVPPPRPPRITSKPPGKLTFLVCFCSFTLAWLILIVDGHCISFSSK